jgi:hypothetical protein
MSCRKKDRVQAIQAKYLQTENLPGSALPKVCLLLGDQAHQEAHQVCQGQGEAGDGRAEEGGDEEEQAEAKGEQKKAATKRKAQVAKNNTKKKKKAMIS